MNLYTLSSVHLEDPTEIFFFYRQVHFSPKNCTSWSQSWLVSHFAPNPWRTITVQKTQHTSHDIGSQMYGLMVVLILEAYMGATLWRKGPALSFKFHCALSSTRTTAWSTEPESRQERKPLNQSGFHGRLLN
jgi:hypothetical protein